MVTTHNLGFPRIGARRELKFALEAFWKGSEPAQHLQDTAADLRKTHWQQQSALDLVPVGDFSLYDQVLDMSFMLGNIPERVRDLSGSNIDACFRIARGRSAGDTEGVRAGVMKKWFDTNYHYIVPELSADTPFQLEADTLLSQLAEARACGVTPKPVIIGPVSYLWLGQSRDGSDRLALLDRLLPVYAELLDRLGEQGAQWVQIDEPVLVTDLDADWRAAFSKTYEALAAAPVKILLATYFGALRDNLETACELPVAGLHIDAVNAADELEQIAGTLPETRVLSAGIINGRNIWKSELGRILDRLEPLAERLQERLWLAPSCSLLHVPVTLDNETRLDPEIRNWMAFAVQKLQEISQIATALDQGRHALQSQLQENAEAMASRRDSPRVHNETVRSAIEAITPELGQRKSAYQTRAQIQRQRLGLPLFPTTSIGSFPQTSAIRKARQQHRKQEINATAYTERMKEEIAHCVREQEKLGLDVLVHGEAERNDMVEYFGEQLEGYVFSQSGWVQSYGSRCVKPPILYGDISRPDPMTIDWILYAQSLTEKPVKGMLTGPVTILNWSFVRDDQPRSQTCRQLALAMREEVRDLEKAGVSIIQIDEAALREGLPLRRSEWQTYLDWAIEAFRISANGVSDETQIHTHMCYSRFNDIIEAIARMDADVITIETSRSDMELLDAFDAFAYPNEIGPGVYDIHSPNIPAEDHIVSLIQKAAIRIPAERLWINPDCGLKTRRWEEVIPALHNMVKAARTLREKSC